MFHFGEEQEPPRRFALFFSFTDGAISLVPMTLFFSCFTPLLDINAKERSQRILSPISTSIRTSRSWKEITSRCPPPSLIILKINTEQQLLSITPEIYLNLAHLCNLNLNPLQRRELDQFQHVRLGK